MEKVSPPAGDGVLLRAHGPAVFGGGSGGKQCGPACWGDLVPVSTKKLNVQLNISTVCLHGNLRWPRQSSCGCRAAGPGLLHSNIS